MNKVIFKLAFRETGIFIVPVILVLLGIVLFKQDPFKFWDTGLGLAAVLLGFCLAWRTFADYGNVRAFIFSRSYSPTRLFLARWLFGLGIIITVGIVIAALVLLGVRQAVQQLLFANGWFPMIRFEELHLLTGYFLAALFTYHTTLYFMLTNRFRSPVRRRGIALCWHWFETLLLVLLGISVIWIPVFLVIVDGAMNFGFPRWAELLVLFVFGIPVLLQLAVAPWFGVYYYNNIEIES